MSDEKDEDSTPPGSGVAQSEKLVSSLSTSSPWLAALLALPLLAKPVTAWALIGMAATRTLPPLWESIQLASKSCESGYGKWTGAFIYVALTMFLINPWVMKHAGGLVGAATNFVAVVRGSKK